MTLEIGNLNFNGNSELVRWLRLSGSRRVSKIYSFLKFFHQIFSNFLKDFNPAVDPKPSNPVITVTKAEFISAPNAEPGCLALENFFPWSNCGGSSLEKIDFKANFIDMMLTTDNALPRYTHRFTGLHINPQARVKKFEYRLGF